MNKHLSLNPIFSVWRTDQLLCIGIPNTETYVEVAYSSENFKLLEKLIKVGVEESFIKNENLYVLLFEKQMLSKFGSTIKRNKSFFDWLKIDIDSLDMNVPILVFGAGAGGSTLIFMLAQFGFTNITVYDADIIELSELEKTMVYRVEDIGTLKVVALKKILLANFSINLKICPELAQNFEDLQKAIELYNPSLVIKACDPNLSFRIHLNDLCFNKGIPFVYMAYSYNYLIMGPLFIPGETCCDNSTNYNYQNKMGKEHDFHKHQKLFSEFSRHPSISFNINTLSSLMLNEIIMFLSGNKERCKTINHQFYFDLVNFRVQASELVCTNECKFSSKQKK